jgi:hypothetical protein
MNIDNSLSGIAEKISPDYLPYLNRKLYLCGVIGG